MKRNNLRSRLLALLVCVFAWVGASAENWSVTFNSDKSVATLTCTEVNGTNNATSFSFPDGGSTNDIKNAGTLIFKTAEGIEITSLGALDAIKPFEATTVDFGAAVFKETDDGVINYTAWDPDRNPHEYAASVRKTKNCMTFKIFDNCSNATLANVQTLCEALFQRNSKMTTTFEIPSSVEVIATLAVDDTPLKMITIPRTVKYICSQAFQNNTIKALIDVTVEGYTAAANKAFDKMITVGQTNADYANYATLHFPEGAEEYFQNMDDKLDVGTSLNKGKFQVWLNNHYSAASTCSSPNGWKEFINAGSGTPEIPTKKVVLRTYSDHTARIVPTGFRAYLVTGVTTSTVNSKTQYTVKLQQIFAIPANTGVILYGEVKDVNTGYILTEIPYWDDPTDDHYVAPYNRLSTTIKDPDNNLITVTNYMVPTVEITTLYPYYKDATSVWDDVTAQGGNWPLPAMAQYYTGTTVTDRNFIMSKLKSTDLANAQNEDYVGFFRVKAGTRCGPNKAYLSLPSDVFKSAEGAEALVIKPTGNQEFRSNEWNTSVDTGNWGQRASSTRVLSAKFAGDDIFFDEFGGIATGVQEVNAQVENKDDYYTLSGQRVSNPKQGIYVKDGKKVIVR